MSDENEPELEKTTDIVHVSPGEPISDIPAATWNGLMECLRDFHARRNGKAPAPEPAKQPEPKPDPRAMIAAERQARLQTFNAGVQALMQQTRCGYEIQQLIRNGVPGPNQIVSVCVD